MVIKVLMKNYNIDHNYYSTDELFHKLGILALEKVYNK